MRRTSTRSYAVLRVPKEVYEDIRRRLGKAGYSDQFFKGARGDELIDMHGVALQSLQCEICAAGLVECDNCRQTWCLDHQPNPLVCPGCGHRPRDD